MWYEAALVVVVKVVGGVLWWHEKKIRLMETFASGREGDRLIRVKIIFKKSQST